MKGNWRYRRTDKKDFDIMQRDRQAKPHRRVRLVERVKDKVGFCIMAAKTITMQISDRLLRMNLENSLG
jgi:hypothetical protein